MKLKLNFTILLVLFLQITAAKVQAAVAENPSQSITMTTLAVLAELPRSDFDSKVVPIIQKELKSCPHCTFVNITPYSEKGDFESEKIQTAIESNLGKFQILFFNWNEKLNAQNKPLNEYLQKISTQNLVIVASAGQPKENESSGQLAKTLLGSIPRVVIIGEIGEKDRLIGQSYYGPEMLTALRPPKDLLGQGFSPLIFASRLTQNFSRQPDWVNLFQEKKGKSKKIWLEMRDLF